MTKTGSFPRYGGLVLSHPVSGKYPPSWSVCWNLFQTMATGEPWSTQMWRLTGPLRREAAPSSSAGSSCNFTGSSRVRLMFLRRLVTFRFLLELVSQGAAMWFCFPIAPRLAKFLTSWAKGACLASTISVLGFGTVLALPKHLPSILDFLRSPRVERAPVFRLASPHLHSSDVVLLR